MAAATVAPSNTLVTAPEAVSPVPVQTKDPLDVAEGIAQIVRAIEARLPHTKVLLLGILPHGRTPADPFRAAVAEVNAVISTLDDGGHVRYLDIGSPFLQPDGSISTGVMADGLHPTLWGYQILTASIWEPLLQLAAVR